MRVLLVLQYYFPYIGGLENLFYNLATRLVQRGHTVHVLTTRLPGTAAHEILDGVEVWRLPVPRRGDRYFFTLAAIGPAVRLARKSDIIHTAPYNGAPPAFLAARRAGRPVILTALEVLGQRWHRVERNPLVAWGYRLFEALVVRLPFHRFVAISQATLRDCLAAGMPAVRGGVIYPGVDEVFTPGQPSGELRARLGIPAHDFLYLYFGRPGKTKGVDILLKAAPQVQLEIPNAHLVLILSDQPREWYLRLCRLREEVSRQARVHFISPVPRAKLVDYLREADCIVIPSRTEGFGLTAAEACAVGRPLVATWAGSLPEVVSGRCVLVEPASSQALAEGVKRIWRGEWDEIPPKRFSWKAMIEAYERLYQEMVG